MVTVNNDYNLRKEICEQRYNKYPADTFEFCNQRVTSIAVKLYEKL